MGNFATDTPLEIASENTKYINAVELPEILMNEI